MEKMKETTEEVGAILFIWNDSTKTFDVKKESETIKFKETQESNRDQEIQQAFDNFVNNVKKLFRK